MVQPISSPTDQLLARAAELRVEGASWEVVAAQVGRAAETVRKWPRIYPTKWKKLVRAAERDLVTDATAESVHTLRRQLRSEDDKTSRDAAQRLIQLRVALGKPTTRGKAANRKRRKQSDLARVTAYLETLTDAEIETLTDRLLADAAAHRAGSPLGATADGAAVPE